MRLRFVATLGPHVDGFAPRNAGDTVSFLSLDRIWPDRRFDPSVTVEFTGDVQSYNPVSEDDLLVPKVSPTFAQGRTAIARGLVNGRALATSEVFVLRPHDKKDADFLQYRLRDPEFLARGRAAWQGVAGLKRVSAEYLKSVQVDQTVWQRRHAIAEFLDRQVSSIRSALDAGARGQDALAQLEREIADRLIEALPSVPLKAVASIHSGVTLNEAKASRDAVPVPYLRVANVKAGWIELDEVKQVPVAREAADRYTLQAGDLLLTEGGDLDKLGRGAVWDGAIHPCLFQNHIFAVRPREDVCVPEFLSWATRSSAARSYFESTASRITNLASTNRTKLGRWPVPQAGIETQRRRIERAEAEWQSARSARDASLRLGERLAEYRDSLIHEAVTGKLDVTRVSERQMDERLHAAAEGRLDEVAV